MENTTKYFFFDGENMEIFTNALACVDLAIDKMNCDNVYFSEVLIGDDSQYITKIFKPNLKSMNINVKNNHCSTSTTYNLSSFELFIDFMVENSTYNPITMVPSVLYNIKSVYKKLDELRGNQTLKECSNTIGTKNKSIDIPNVTNREIYNSTTCSNTIETKNKVIPNPTVAKNNKFQQSTSITTTTDNNLNTVVNDISKLLENVIGSTTTIEDPSSKAEYKKKMLDNLLDKSSKLKNKMKLLNESSLSTSTSHSCSSSCSSSHSSSSSSSESSTRSSSPIIEDEKNTQLNKLQYIADNLEKKIKEESKINENDEEKLMEHERRYHSDKNQLLRKEKQINSKKDIFNSEYNYTYRQKLLPLVYPKLFPKENEKQVKMEISEISPMFLTKFLILLFMEGRNIEGAIIDTKLVNREDSYILYDYLLYASTSDDGLDNYEFFINKTDVTEYIQIALKFLTYLPEEYSVYSPQEIMKVLNEDDKDGTHAIFKTDFVDQDENSDNEDSSGNKTSNETYSM